MHKQTSLMLFEHQSAYPCSAEELYNWHSRQGALERLLPPWQNISVVARQGTIEPGGMVELAMHAGPFPYRFRTRHIDNIPGKMFRDIQEKGPFSSWSHSHYFSNSAQGALLQDQVEYGLPGQRFLPGFIKKYVHKNLQLLRMHTFTALYGWNLSGLAVISRHGDFPIRLHSQNVILLHWLTVLILCPLGYFYPVVAILAVCCYGWLLFILLFKHGRVDREVVAAEDGVLSVERNNRELAGL